MRHKYYKHQEGFPGGSNGKESTCSVGDLGLIPGQGRSPGGGHGNPLHPCPENTHGQRSLVLLSMGSQRVGHRRVPQHSTVQKEKNCISSFHKWYMDSWRALNNFQGYHEVKIVFIIIPRHYFLFSLYCHLTVGAKAMVTKTGIDLAHIKAVVPNYTNSHTPHCLALLLKKFDSAT